MTEVTPRFKAVRAPQRRRGWNSTLPAGSRSPKRKRARRERVDGQVGVTPEMRAEVLRRAEGRCQADGLHHPDCPGVLTAGDWVPHHVWERRNGGPDTVENLVAVWCPMGLGLNGCHGRIHGRPGRAVELGLLYVPTGRPVGGYVTRVTE